MLKQLLLLLAILSLGGNPVFAGGPMKIIKVTGTYAIINKGANQGVEKGQTFEARRATERGLAEIGEVRVIRVTANRAAVEQLSNSQTPILRKGDRLYGHNEEQVAEMQRRALAEAQAMRRRAEKAREERTRIEPITEPVHRPVVQDDPPPSIPKVTRHRPADKVKPWISINAGTVVPYNNFANSYSPSFSFGGSYLLPVGKQMLFGLEINNTFVNQSSLSNPAVTGFSKVSSSLLQAHVVLQRFFGRYFFLEAGGGLYRPKIVTVSIDNVESTYSSTHLGFFAGTGFFVPTSPYAGVSFKGRLHNYFDSSNKQYYGVTGGFRFKIR